MDFPMFHLDWLNNRMLIAIIAILHVIINHGLAVGFMPFVTWLEHPMEVSGSSLRSRMFWIILTAAF